MREVRVGEVMREDREGGDEIGKGRGGDEGW